MQHQEFLPPQELQNTIRCFWYDRMEFGEDESEFEVVPDSYVEIIFHFGSACSIFYDGSLQLLPSPFMMGLQNQPIRFQTGNCLEIMAVRCYPWAVSDLLGLPSGGKQVRAIDHPLAGLQPVLAKYVLAGKMEEAMAQLTHFFLHTTARVSTVSMLSKAGAAMTKEKGTLSVNEVAAAAHATVRTLERNFKKSSGHTVKDVSGLMRFEQARNQLWLYPDANLAGLAHELGYTDQAHFSKEFKRYSGTSPAAFARKAKKGKQLASSDFVAFLQA